MEKYFKRKSIAETSQLCSGVNDHENQHFSKKNCFEVDLENLPFDLGFQPRITFYHPNVRDQSKVAMILLFLMGFAIGRDLKNLNIILEGNFLELLHYTAKQNEEYRLVALENAPGHDKLIAPSIQKDIINAFAVETINKLISDLGDAFFSILVDEARDGSNKEQMTIILRYVNKRGCVVECLLNIMHVTDTTALFVKMRIETLFSKYNLSISRLHGQGYDGASNMRDQFNGVKALILKDNEYAFYVHCFAHQLQLALVAVAKKDTNIERLFLKVSCVINIVGWSPRRRDLLNEKQPLKVKKAIKSGELSTGQGLNQDTNLKRLGETRWGSHYGTLLSLINLFSSVVEVLEDLTENSDNRVEASDLVDYMTSFDFAFNLHMMKNISGITFELSQALQRKDQDIINAMSLVHLSKRRLLLIRNNGWDNLFDEVSHFYIAHNIDVPNMQEKFVARGRSRRNIQEMTNLFHYRVELFYAIIDLQLSELNNCFNEGNTKLLICMASLNPSDCFQAFDKGKLVGFAQFYPLEFSSTDLMALELQLDNYIDDMRSNIATASVERAFSAMKIVKTHLRNQMGDQFLNDSLIPYVEKTIFDSVDKEVVMQRFLNMKPR
ncbi:zinc finger MYM-type protein 1-like [Pistacia vera]|uniref:zinc finger MYM-type protein 1-like n=1 Tax=Pistacia vera TaxID=55513 RepID=UPI001262F4AF|nr:zinc finger MYM-type protein 1-like [Pistacia vera]